MANLNMQTVKQQAAAAEQPPIQPAYAPSLAIEVSLVSNTYKAMFDSKQLPNWLFLPLDWWDSIFWTVYHHTDLLCLALLGLLGLLQIQVSVATNDIHLLALTPCRHS
jgi:hypothetical protein